MRIHALSAAVVTTGMLVAGSALLALPASAATNYTPPCGKITLSNWSAKNVSCSKSTRHINYVNGDGWKYHAYVGKGRTSSAPVCYAHCDQTAFQHAGSNGSTGYRF